MNTGMTIDGRDAYATWGVRLLDGSLGSVVCWPPLKEASVPVNRWQEEEGIEADLTAPKLDTRNITLNLATDGSYSHYRQLISTLQGAGYHSLYFGPLDKAFDLRLVGWGNYDYGEHLGFVSVTLADDNPLDGYEYETPGVIDYGLPYTLPFELGGQVIADGTYTLDGRPMDYYGVKVLLGTESHLWSQGDPRLPLVRNIASRQGAIYDTLGLMRNDAPQVRLACLLRADTAAQMWAQWYALLYDLSQPYSRKIGGSTIEGERKFYYKSCAVQEFEIDDLQGAWIKFVITVQLLDPLPVAAGYGLPYVLPFILG